ncbi:hypothetical protein V5799_025039 [Amblyomma americanum]|uniref:Uncharacterized protein n=1 Tax=Amblyomma americanum TaxID=6943 RepID=A0AAQ4EAT2_AMBAM
MQKARLKGAVQEDGKITESRRDHLKISPYFDAHAVAFSDVTTSFLNNKRNHNLASQMFWKIRVLVKKLEEAIASSSFLTYTLQGKVAELISH